MYEGCVVGYVKHRITHSEILMFILQVQANVSQSIYRIPVEEDMDDAIFLECWYLPPVSMAMVCALRSPNEQGIGFKVEHLFGIGILLKRNLVLHCNEIKLV